MVKVSNRELCVKAQPLILYINDFFPHKVFSSLPAGSLEEMYGIRDRCPKTRVEDFISSEFLDVWKECEKVTSDGEDEIIVYRGVVRRSRS